MALHRVRHHADRHLPRETVTAQTFSLIVGGVGLNAIAQLLLKAGVRPLGVLRLEWASACAVAFQWPIAAGLACYTVSVVLWIVALSRMDVSVAYPMLSLGYVVNALAAWWLFDEALGSARIGGIALILVGVYLLARS